MSIEGCSKSDLAFLSHAIRIAKTVNSRSRHGAVIKHGGRVIGWGVNRSRTHNRWYTDRDRSQCSIHAEVSALRKAGVCRGGVVYVARVNRFGLLRQSAPCVNCKRALLAAGIKRIVHT